jgi:hypothetical protein
MKIDMKVPKHEARTILMRRVGDKKASFHFNSMINKPGKVGGFLAPSRNPYANMNLDVPT